MATVAAESKPKAVSRVNRFDSPWFNPKLVIGIIVLVLVGFSGVIGERLWDPTLARVASSPLDLPPPWCPSTIAGIPVCTSENVGTWDHPLGTESNGRDMLAVLLTGSSRSLRVGLIAATIGMVIGVILGCIAGFMGGTVDRVITTISDSWITIPSLAVLIVISAFVRQISAETMAILISLFAWPGPTRLIRAQVLTLRERGYIRMARLSGASTLDVIFGEMMPNMLPYIAASFTGNVSGAILASTGLEALGLGPTRIPTLGMTIFYANQKAAVIRGMTWWYVLPILVLALIFTNLFNIATGLDEVANPRLRGLNTKE
jgi:peptide/nickel transport system permease protein